MKKFALASAAVSMMFVGAASAADIAVKARPAPVPVFTWSGCYIGGNAGWIGSDGRQDTAPGGSYLAAPGANPPPNLQGTGDFAANIPVLSDHYGTHGSGGLVGVQAGCNVQNGAFVFGVEGDWAWTSLKSTTTAAYLAFPDVGNPGFIVAPRAEQVSTRLDSLATFRGRAGFAWDRLYLYGTGGLAIGDVRSDTNVTFGAIGGPSVYNGAVHIGSGSSWQVGWTAGVGGEYAFDSNWSLKAEYLYVDLGTFGYTSPLIAAVPAFVPGYNWRTSVNERDHMVRVGINYRWGGPVVAKH